MADQGMLADASPLIYLAKADVLAVAARIAGPLRATPAVWEEAIEMGLRGRHRDASRLELAADEGVLHRVDWKPSFQRRSHALGIHHRLGPGESQVLALAEKGERILMDDGRASRVAIALHLAPLSTLALPVLGRRSRAIGSEEAQRMLRALANVIGVRADVLGRLEGALAEDA